MASSAHVSVLCVLASCALSITAAKRCQAIVWICDTGGEWRIRDGRNNNDE